MNRIVFLILFMTAVTVAAADAAGQIPEEINYQGLLTDKTTGEPLAGPVDLTFRLYNYEDCGTGTPVDALWSENHTGVSLNNGIFNVRLGSAVSFPDTLRFDGQYCLGIHVAGEEVLPRPVLVSSAYALNARDVFGQVIHPQDIAFTGPINDPSNPVDWNALRNVPAGIADGVDDIGTGGGGINVLPGAGLEEEIIGDDKILSVTPGGIVETMLADSAVTGDKIRTNSITAAQIAPGAITSGEIAAGAVTASRIAPSTITAAEISGNTITAAQISPATITAGEIFGNTLTAEQLATASVKSDELADSAVTTGKIHPGAVTTVEIADGTILLGDLDDNGASAGQVIKYNGSGWGIADDGEGGIGDITSVTAGAGLGGGGDTLGVTVYALFGGSGAADSVARSDHGHDDVYVNEGQVGAVVGSMILDGTVSSSDIEDGTVSTIDLGDGAVSTAKLDSASVTNDKLSAEAVTEAILGFGSVTSDKISDGTIGLGDIGRNGAADGQVIKWNGTAWAAADDSVGGGSGGGSGWIDDGGTLRLETLSDSVGIGIAAPTEKLELDGNFKASGTAVIGPAHIVGSGTGINVTGESHDVYGDHLVIGGGRQNEAHGHYTTVGGGRENRSENEYATVAGGWNNRASGSYSFIGGGGGDEMSLEGNRAEGEYATIAGGKSNTAGSTASPPEQYAFATIGGGEGNQATHRYSTVGGGKDNDAGAEYAVIGGGQQNRSENWSFVGGGSNNRALNGNSTVGGGMNNLADQGGTVGGGSDNRATQNGSAVPGGRDNEAEGNGAFAAGTMAKARYDGSIVFSANWSVTGDDSVAAGGTDQFVIRADGGMYVTNTSGQAPYNPSRLIDTSTGAYLGTDGMWHDSSDRALKENFEEIDREELLEKIAELPVTRWNYRIEGEDVKHIGPVAQDFHAVLGIGNDDRTIAALDGAGVSIAAIQRLYEKSKMQEGEIELLKKEVAELRGLVRDLLKEH